ncbi:putative gustatory receptor 59b [Drosophila eugracilis]|uniref:putative gustatory receptor 59b n=1 Tax=Drosophila eugracilis TaxID=29029 RepID=UPI001BD9D3A5|nr:putative gustatory receptor 59b [Drosophila eugracilis]
MAFALVKIYFGYSLVIGITSQKLDKQSFQSTLFTRVYALIANIITLAMLPLAIWHTRLSFLAIGKFPRLILITNDVRHVVSYLVIVYTVLSRGFRDTAFKEMTPLLRRLLQEERRGTGIRRARRSLKIILYVKFFTVWWLCITESFFVFFSWNSFTWMKLVQFIVMSNAMNILEMVPMGYFLGLWHIARGFDYVNKRMDEIKTSKSIRDLKELQDLWGLHAGLTKTALKINRTYGPQMLASRFDHFIIGVVQAYWGAFFAYNRSTSFLWIAYGFGQYYIRSLDYYLIDYMCDLVVKYQGAAKHSWSESHWTKEISSYVIYVNSSKLQLWTCGLFQANRSLWFEMMSSVLYYILVVLQFHLVMGN